MYTQINEYFIQLTSKRETRKDYPEEIYGCGGSFPTSFDLFPLQTYKGRVICRLNYKSALYIQRSDILVSIFQPMLIFLRVLNRCQLVPITDTQGYCKACTFALN